MNNALFKKSVALAVIFTWVVNIMPVIPAVHAQTVAASPVVDTFHPVIIQGLTLDPSDPFRFEFIVDEGDQFFSPSEFIQESRRLVSYFMGSLTVPEDEMWVNLSPYEPDRIIADALGETELGRDLLAQDYILKQMSAAMLHPDNDLGSQFWDTIYQRVYDESGSFDVPMNIFNKIWIVPDSASVYVNKNSAFVVDRHLKVMLEEDYLAMKNSQNKDMTEHKDLDPEGQELTTSLIRRIIIPEIEKKVNEGAEFAPLRQIFNSMILASWYKKNFKQGILNKVYADQNKVLGIDLSDKRIKEKIYDQYIKSFKKGAYDFIREEYDPRTQTIIPRKYFSGGVEGVKDVDIIDSAMASASLTAKIKRLLAGKKRKVDVQIEGIDTNRNKIKRAFFAGKSLLLKSFITGVVLALSTLSPIYASGIEEQVSARIKDATLEKAGYENRLEELYSDLEKAESIVSRYETKNLNKAGIESEYKVKDHIIELKQTARISVSENTKFEGVSRIGLLGGSIYSESQGLDNSVLKPSGYKAFDLFFDYDNYFTTQVGLGAGFSYLRSRKYDTGVVDLSSYEREHIADIFSQAVGSASLYADLGKTFRISENFATSLFLGADFWGIYGGEKLMTLSESSIGANGVYYSSADTRWRFFSSFNFLFLLDNLYEQDWYTFRPVFDSLVIGGDYAKRISDTSRILLGAKGILSNVDSKAEVSFDLGYRSFGIENAVSYQHSRNPSIPNVFGINSKILFQITDGFTAGIKVSGLFKEYEHFDSHSSDVQAGIFIKWDLITSENRIHRVKVEQNRSVAGEKGKPKIKFEGSPDIFLPNADDHLFSLFTDLKFRGQVESGEHPRSSEFSPWLETVRKLDRLLYESKSYDDLVKNADVKDIEDIFIIVSALNNASGQFNYNYSGEKSGFSSSVPDIYSAIRAGIIQSQEGKDPRIPVFDCSGAAAFFSKLTTDLSGKIDDDIYVNTVDVVGESQGGFSLHDVVLVTTKKYGICIVDWGRVIPTFSYDFQTVTEIYQAMQGMPSVYHTIFDVDQKYVGILFSEQGKAILEALTLLGENERGYERTLNRFMEKAEIEAQGAGRSFLGINHPDEAPSMELLEARWKAFTLKRQIEQVKKQMELIDNAKKTSGPKDNAMTTDRDEKVGGIDLNSKNMDLNVSGDNFEYEMPDDVPGFSGIRADGFMPVIINITPVQSLLPVLGLGSPGQKDFKLSKKQ